MLLSGDSFYMDAPNHFEKLVSYLPVDLTRFWPLAFFVVLGFVVVRYFLLVLPFFWYFYRGPGLRQWASRRLYPTLPSRSEQWFEIRWSLFSSLIFAAVGVGWGLLWQLGHTQLYLKFDEFGWVYFSLIGPLVLLLLHDTYFYWTHRWLHRPRVYRMFHSVHHQSLKPSPWASFSFHPIESLINALALPLISLILPLHPVHVLVHLTFMTVSAITNHLGYEVLPRSAVTLGWGKYLISGVHHVQHHRFFRCNYGLFFSFWDLWMKTENANFSSEFEARLQSEKATAGSS